MLQRGRARVVGSLRAQLNTGVGAVVDDFQLIRADLALPSCSVISVEEDFLVVPTLTAGLILLGMTFLQSNCILDLPEFSIIFAGPWQREHRISLDGRVVRCLTLVAQNDVIIPPCDPNEEEAYVVPVRALEFCGDVAGTARQVHEPVTTHSLFTLSSTAENCKLTRGRGGVTFCNLSNGPVTLKQGQVLAEWRPSTTVYVITTSSGEVLLQPVDSADLDSIDTASPGEPKEEKLLMFPPTQCEQLSQCASDPESIVIE
jgi:hypothetical protein